jgi:hypothetical protein
MGVIAREKAVSHTMIGAFGGETLAIVSAAAEAGCFQIGGCGRNTTQMPWFVALCDYSIIGEEVYAIGAYLSQDPTHLGQLAGQDMGKILTIVLMLLGLVFYAAGSKALVNILGM